MKASEIIELQRQRIWQLERENERRDKLIAWYLNEIAKELKQEFPRIQTGKNCDPHSCYVMLADIRKAHGKDATMDNDPLSMGL